jgi:hypothetical protein
VIPSPVPVRGQWPDGANDTPARPLSNCSGCGAIQVSPGHTCNGGTR